MNDILIHIETSSSKAYCENNRIGVKHANLQNKLIFEMSEKIKGTAWLEYEINGIKRLVEMEEIEMGYQIDIRSCLLISDYVNVDLKIIESENSKGIPIFVSTITKLEVYDSINADEEEPEQYPSWFESANKVINEANNLDLDVTKSNGVATVTVTKKDGTEKSVKIYDGSGGGSSSGTGTIEDINFDIVDGYLQMEYSEDTNIDFYINDLGELEVVM